MAAMRLLSRPTAPPGSPRPSAATSGASDPSGLARSGRLALLALVLLIPPGAALRADPEFHDGDHDRAHRAVMEGQIRPLTDLLPQVAPALGGRILDVELETEHGRMVYEFTVVSPDGRVREVMVDAATARIIPDDHDERRRH